MRRSLLIAITAMSALLAVSATMAETITYVTTWTDIGTSPRGLGIDTAGNIYVADYDGDQTLKCDSNGTLQQTFTTAGGGGQPGDVAVSPIDGSVYVCETGWPDYYAHQYSSAGVELNSWLQTDNCLGIETDSAGNVYTSGYNGFFTKRDSSGNQISSWALNGSQGVTGLALDPTETYAYTIRNIGTGILERINLTAGTKESFATLDNISNAYGGRGMVAVNSNTGNIYVSERGKNQIEEFDSTGAFIQKWNAFASPGDVVSSSATTSFGTIFGIAVDSDLNRIYVADQQSKIYVFQSESVPEPTTMALLATGLLGVLGYTWRKRK